MSTAVLTAADLPPGQPYVSPDDLSAITPLWQEVTEASLIPIVAQVYNDAAGALHAGLVDVSEQAVPAITSLASEQYLAAARNTFEAVGADLWETARNELLEGFQKGESIPELRDRLRQSAGLTGRRATLVARTQVLDASNAGSYDTAQASGLDLVKGWEATPDFRTRETHLMAGSTYSGPGMIGLAETFMVGGWPCERPHDPELPPEERYNCRCTLVYQMRHVPVDPHQAYLDDLAAQHQAKLAKIQAQYEARLAAIEAKHEAKLAAIEITATTPSVSVETAIVNSETKLAQAIAAHEARKAKLLADYEFRRGKLMSDYDYRVAKAKGEIPPPQPPYQLPEIPKAPAAPPPAPLPQPVSAPSAVAHAVQIPIRDSLANAKTIPEVRAAFIQEWKNAIASEPGAVRGAARFLTTGDVQTAREHAEGLLRAIERFPMVRIDVTHSPIVEGHWAETAGRVITFNDEFARGRDDYLLSLRLAGIPDERGVAWGLMSTRSPQAIAMHEFGHALHHAISRNKAGDYSYQVELNIGKEARAIAQAYADERYAASQGFAFYDAVGRELGGYARTDGHELIGEAFADVMVNGDAASELSRRIVAMLIRRYEAQNGPMSGPPLVGLPKLPAKGKPALKLEAPSEARFTLAADTGASGDGYAAPGLWGRYGAGGVLTRVETSSGPRFLLVQRGPSVSDNVGKWQLPGGALNELETAYQGIARETIEELGASESWLGSLTPVAEHVFQDQASGWKYTSVIARAPKRFTPVVDGTETSAARWFTQAQLEKMLADGKIVPGLEPTLQDLIAGFSKAVKVEGAVDDGLEKLTLVALKDLAKSRGINVAPKITKADLITQIRLTEKAEQQLANAIAEAIDLVERIKDTKGFAQAVKEAKALLKDYPGGELAYQKILSIGEHQANTLLQRLRTLATQRNLTLPVGDELKAIKAARLKAAKAAAAVARAEKAAKAAIDRQVKAVERGDFTSLVRVGPQAGSNPGGVFVDASGQRWYVKESTEQWAREQQLSAALYNLALRDAANKDLFATPPIVIGQGTPGLSRWQVATRIIEADRDLDQRLADAAYLAQVREGFAIDAWLANWDVAGQTFDNIVTILPRYAGDLGAGRPIRIDVGGTLRFRAQGGAKGSAFGDDVLEWETLRDPLKSPTGSRLFADMTLGEMRVAIAKLKAITPARIEAMVRSHGLDEKLAARLIARREDLLLRAARELEIDANFKQMLTVALRGKKALTSTRVRLTSPQPGSFSISADVLQGITSGNEQLIRHELMDYRGSGHRQLNGALRSGKSQTWLRNTVDLLDEAQDASALPNPILGFRGIEDATHLFGQSFGADLTGFEWMDPGYTSMSVDKARAGYFAHGWGRQGVMLRIIVPKGVSGIQLSGYNYEAEIMLDRGLLFRVVADHGVDKQGRRQLDVEVIGRVGARTKIT